MQIEASAGKSGSESINQTDKPKIPQRISSAHFLKLVEECGQIGFWSSEFATGQVTVSVGLYRILGIDPALPLVYEDMLNLIHPDDRPTHEDMRQVVHAGRAIERDYRIIRPDRTLRWIRNKAEPIADTLGRPARAVGIIFDVTAEYDMRQSVDRSADRYRTLAKAIAAVVWKADRDGVPEIDPAWLDLTGQTYAQANGFGWLGAVHPDDRDETVAAWQAAVAEHGIYQMDHRIRCTDGVYRWLNARAAPVIGFDGTVREWVGVILKESGKKQHQDLMKLAAADDAGRIRGIQIRAARALLDWSLNDLALAANISMSSVRRMECEENKLLRQPIAAAAQKALEDAGIEFMFGEDGQLGVSLP